MFICRASERDEHFDATKLNKILFCSDFWAYRKLGHSITGENYQKLASGPAPKRLAPVVRKMVRERVFASAERDFFGRTQKILVALREPDLSLFSGAEIAIVQDVIRKLWDLNTTGVSEFSHEFVGWQLAAEGEEIPYSTALLGRPRPPTPAEVEHGRHLI